MVSKSENGASNLPSIDRLIHDLGQPLLAIRLNAELLQHDLQGSGSAATQQRVLAILQACQETQDLLEKTVHCEIKNSIKSDA